MGDVVPGKVAVLVDEITAAEDKKISAAELYERFARRVGQIFREAGIVSVDSVRSTLVRVGSAAAARGINDDEKFKGFESRLLEMAQPLVHELAMEAKKNGGSEHLVDVVKRTLKDLDLAFGLQGSNAKFNPPSARWVYVAMYRVLQHLSDEAVYVLADSTPETAPEFRRVRRESDGLNRRLDAIRRPR